jgi:hypothetical protein
VIDRFFTMVAARRGRSRGKPIPPYAQTYSGSAIASSSAPSTT